MKRAIISFLILLAATPIWLRLFPETREDEAQVKSVRSEARSWGDAPEDELQKRIDEVENLLEKMHFGRVTHSEWDRIQEIVNERKMQRYVTCLNSGMDERTAAGAFDD